jgi:hypothetical protein
MRVCLPIFAQDILDSLNMLDLNSSASKSLKSVNFYDKIQYECSAQKDYTHCEFMSGQKIQKPELTS